MHEPDVNVTLLVFAFFDMLLYHGEHIFVFALVFARRHALRLHYHYYVIILV